MSALEKRTLENTKVRQARALKHFHEAQREYEKAAAKHLPTAKKLRKVADDAKAYYYYKRRSLTRKARKDVNTPDIETLHVEKTKLSPCKSSRNGVKPRLIVLHITVSHNRPGTADLDGILDYFGNLSTQASSHIVNDAEGHDGRCVLDADKAWTQAAYNSQGLSIEQIEYADKPAAAWHKDNAAQLENTALWIAHWSHKYGIPITKSTNSGVCRHSDLGLAGGGHTDPGAGYPFEFVLKRAREIKAAKYS